MMKKNILKLSFGLVASIISFSAFAQCPTITCPSDVVVNNDPGGCNAVVTYTAPTGLDLCEIATQTFNFTGALQTWTVPAGVNSITIEAWGAQGQGGNGGLGGYVKGDMNVTPGQVLNIYVGDQNGYNGGGIGYAADPRNGGGASDVRVLGLTLNDRVIVAGGGGSSSGDGNYQGGHGGGGTLGANYAGGQGGLGYSGSGGNGGLNGGAGITATHSGGGGGGGFTSGGGAACQSWSGLTCGTDGLLGVGGNGDTWENGICFNSYGGTSGGGGGYYGGGGSSTGNCGSGGGGGGSSFSGTLTNTTFMGGVKTGNGQVDISYAGSTVSTIQTAGLGSGATFPIGTTTETYEASNGFGTVTCSFTVTVLDTEVPVEDVATLLDSISECPVTPIAPTATDNCTGAVTGTTTTIFPITASGTTTITWTYDDGNGNTSTQTQDVIITPIVSSVTQLGDTLTADATGYSYQWVDCDNANAPVIGAINQSFVPTAGGNYAVVVSNGDCDVTSPCNNVTVGMNESSAFEGISIYPNPTNDIVTVHIAGQSRPVKCRVMTMDGKLVVAGKNITGNNIVIDLSNESKGIYILRLEDENSSKMVKLIKQ